MNTNIFMKYSKSKREITPWKMVQQIYHKNMQPCVRLSNICKHATFWVNKMKNTGVGHTNSKIKQEITPLAMAWSNYHVYAYNMTKSMLQSIEENSHLKFRWNYKYWSTNFLMKYFKWKEELTPSKIVCPNCHNDMQIFLW